MIAHGHIGVEHITGSGLTDPLVADILNRITVDETERHSDRFPASRIADVVVTTISGERFESGDVHARGGPEAPMSRDDIIDKFMSFAAPVLGESRANEIREATLGLAKPNSRFSELACLLFDPPETVE